MTDRFYEHLWTDASDVQAGDLIQDMRSWAHVDSVTPHNNVVLIVHRFQAQFHKNDRVEVLRPFKLKGTL